MPVRKRALAPDAEPMNVPSVAPRSAGTARTRPGIPTAWVTTIGTVTEWVKPPSVPETVAV